MSNNAPDYEDNLVFPPQEIKSQDNLTTSGSRQSGVLIETINNAQCWFDVARDKTQEVARLETKLKILLSILLRVSPEHEGYIRANFPKYFEELDK